MNKTDKLFAQELSAYQRQKRVFRQSVSNESKFLNVKRSKKKIKWRGNDP